MLPDIEGFAIRKAMDAVLELNNELGTFLIREL